MKRKAVYLSDEIRQKIQAHAGEEYPFECCGILFGTRSENDDTDILEYISMDNVCSAEKKSKYFYIDPLRLYDCENEYRRKGLDIIGFAHSHPDAGAYPSQEDTENMIPGQLYLILDVRKDRCMDIRIWEKDIKQEHASELYMDKRGEEG